VQYYVISGDGQRYGPADIPTLNQWINEGRLLSHQLLEDAATGVRVPASGVAGLVFPQQTQQTFHNYPRDMGMGFAGDDGSKDVTQAWIFGAIGLLIGSCCCLFIVFPVLGIIAAGRAEKKGNRNANAAKIFNIVVLVLIAGGQVVFPILMGGGNFFNRFGN
jgi:hypothetical protein